MKLEEKESEISGIYGHEFLYSVTFSERIIPMQAHSDQYNPLNTPSTYMVKKTYDISLGSLDGFGRLDKSLTSISTPWCSMKVAAFRYSSVLPS